MATWLRQNTAVDIMLGPFVDQTDGFTAETALTLTQPDIRLSKNGGAFAQKSAAQTLVHGENGWYPANLSTTDTNTLGMLIVAVNEAGALPVWREFIVVVGQVYDSFAGADLLQVDSRELGGTVQTAGDLMGTIGGVGTAARTGDPDSTSTLISYLKQTINNLFGTNGIATFPAAAAPANNVSLAEVIRQNYVDIQTLLTALGGLADAAVTGDPGTTASLMAYQKQLVNILIGTAGIATFPAAGVPANAVSLAEVIRQNYNDLQLALGRLPAALVGGRMDASVGAMGANVMTAAAADPTLANEIADQVWDEALAGHLTAGSTGAALSGAAEPAGDPWTTPLPGAYAAGTAGKIVGDNVNAPISSRATQASVDDVPTAGENADAVWDEALSGHAGAGSAGAALTAAAGATGGGVIEGTWIFSVNTTMADPGNGTVRLNNAAALSATLIALDRLTDTNVDQSNVIRRLVAGDVIYIQDQNDAANWIRYQLTGPATDMTGWFELPVAALTGAGVPVTGNDKLLFLFDRPGVDAIYPEPGQEAPPATASLATKINYLYKLARNKITSSSTTIAVYNDAGTVVDQKAAQSEAAGVYTRGELGTGP